MVLLNEAACYRKQYIDSIEIVNKFVVFFCGVTIGVALMMGLTTKESQSPRHRSQSRQNDRGENHQSQCFFEKKKLTSLHVCVHLLLPNLKRRMTDYIIILLDGSCFVSKLLVGICWTVGFQKHEKACVYSIQEHMEGLFCWGGAWAQRRVMRPSIRIEHFTKPGNHGTHGLISK